jgi:hypothetical protein
MLRAGEWTERFRAWHAASEFQRPGPASSGYLAGREYCLLQSYLPMYEATGDLYWLDRFVAHADRVVGAMQDVPASGEYWAGYRDGFRGWGTRAGAGGRYHEYILHDSRICLPVARFIRIVRRQPDRLGRYGGRADRYLAAIEQHVIAKWFLSLGSGRGTGEDLEHFSSWRDLPVGPRLAFGELLLVLADIARLSGGRSSCAELPAGFASRLADSIVGQCRTVPGPGNRPDVSQLDATVSFALEAFRQGRSFAHADMQRFAEALLAAGIESLDGDLYRWLQLAEFAPSLGDEVEEAYRRNPVWSCPVQAGPEMALTMAGLARRESLLPDRGRSRRNLATREHVLVVESMPLALYPSRRLARTPALAICWQ